MERSAVATREWVSSQIVKSLKGYSGKHDYTLPAASHNSLGGVMVDNNTITISGGVISAKQTQPYQLPKASKDTLGGIKVGRNLTVDEDGTLNAQAGGGTDVEANPAGSATEELEKIKIGETIYSIPEGGSGSDNKYTEEETVIGTYLDKKLYRKVVNVPNPTHQSYSDIPGVTDIDTIVNYSGYIIISGADDKFSLSKWFGIKTVNGMAQYYNYDLPNPIKMVVILEYTKQ